LDIVKERCRWCGHLSECFDCSPQTVLERRFSHYGTVGQYTNTKQLQYRKIQI
jgi:hypothetical protein